MQPNFPSRPRIGAARVAIHSVTSRGSLKLLPSLHPPEEMSDRASGRIQPTVEGGIKRLQWNWARKDAGFLSVSHDVYATVSCPLVGLLSGTCSFLSCDWCHKIRYGTFLIRKSLPLWEVRGRDGDLGTAAQPASPWLGEDSFLSSLIPPSPRPWICKTREEGNKEQPD